VSKAESQFALPLKTTTFLAESVIGSPKGSAVVTEGAGAGLADAAGAGGGLADGSAAGLAVGAGAGAGLADADGVGDGDGACASALPIPSQIAAAIGTAKARRGRKGRFIRISP
jgi:hypothetical protein